MCILRWFVGGCLAIAGDTVKLFRNREQNPLLGSELSLDYSCTSDVMLLGQCGNGWDDVTKSYKVTW